MKVKSLCLAVIIITALVSPFTTSSQGADKNYYICFDNSGSMKRFDFYQRLIGALLVNMEREGLTGDNIKYIPFGERQAATIIDKYADFDNEIKNKTYPTTDFSKLCQALENINTNSIIIIISDGEHDLSSAPPFSHLTGKELGQMVEVVDKLKQRKFKIHTVHILKEYNSSGQALDINKFYSRIRPGASGMEIVIDKGNIIAGLTRDFMKKLTDAEDNYHFCTGNKDAVKALLDIFDISLPEACDYGRFRETVPLNIVFNEYVDENTRDWFWRELGQKKFCIEGIERRFLKDQNSTDFSLSIQYINNDAYTIEFGYENIWDERRIANQSDMTDCIDSIIENTRKKIKNEFSGASAFSVPECLLSIKFLDEKLYAFLSQDNFKLYVGNSTCDKKIWQNAKVFFFDEGKRVYLSVPMIISDKLSITVPGDNDNLNRGLLFPLSPATFDSWDSPELTVREGDVNYPSINYDFSNFIHTNKGVILFFSADIKRFFGFAGKEASTNEIKLFKGQKYKIYFVPDDIEKMNIKSLKKTIDNTSNISDALDILKPTPDDVAFSDWGECLQKYKDAIEEDNTLNANKRDIVARQIAVSNGYFLLLHHLGEIIEDNKKKQTFTELLDKTIEIYKGIDSPFEAIDLLQADIPAFSSLLRDKYMGLGRRGIMLTILQVLSNPISNLTQLRHYINGNIREVTQENQKYFDELVR